MIHCPRNGSSASRKDCNDCQIKKSCPAKQISDQDRRYFYFVIIVGTALIIAGILYFRR